MRRCLLVLVVPLALAACGSDSPASRAEATSTTVAEKAPIVGDHWHVALGLSRCGEALPDPPQEPEDVHGIHTHADGLIHVHPFDDEASGANAVLGVFLDDIGATVDSEGLHLADGDDLPFTGECDGPAALTIVRWSSPDDANPTVTTAHRPDDLLEVPLRPDGSLLAIALTDDPASVELPASAPNLEEPTDGPPATAAPDPNLRGVLPDPEAPLLFAPVLAEAAPPCSPTGVPSADASTCYELGPAAVDASAVEHARATDDLAGQWSVDLVLTQQGIDRFNAVAAECYSRTATCQAGLLAIVLEGTVASAPSIQARSFKRDQITISGGFSEAEAKDLARSIQR